MRKFLIIIISVLFFLVLYNNFFANNIQSNLKQIIEEKFSKIDIELAKKYDLNKKILLEGKDVIIEINNKILNNEVEVVIDLLNNEVMVYGPDPDFDGVYTKEEICSSGRVDDIKNAFSKLHKQFSINGNYFYQLRRILEGKYSKENYKLFLDKESSLWEIYSGIDSSDGLDNYGFGISKIKGKWKIITMVYM